MPSNDAITIRETNEIGEPTATYIYSATTESLQPRIRDSPEGAASHRQRRRVDVVRPSRKESPSYLTSLLIVFLPAGYPHSVSDDYMDLLFLALENNRKYKDSLQAFSSSIAGLLASRAVLQGVGVGDASASPTVALLHSVLQESMGRIATILFAHRLGTSLEPECKLYRLAADVLNDSAMVVECLSPAFPKHLRVVLLTFSSILRALCGVAAGSSKASLSSHFAKWGNLGELNAKDSSQETVISLLGMLCGSLVVSHISTPLTTGLTLIFLLLIHLSTNYAAVRAVNMTTLNRQRANIVFSTLFEEGRALTPKQTSKCERIFERDGILRWKASSTTLGFCRIGIAFQELLRSSNVSCRANSIRDIPIDIPRLLRLFEKEEYILWFNPVSKKGTIVLKNNVKPVSQLKAWSHALLVAKHLMKTTEDAEKNNNSPITKGEVKLERQNRKKNYKDTAADVSNPDTMLSILESTLQTHSMNFAGQISRLKDAGWDIDSPSLETNAGRRLEVVG
ncbi:DUF647 domain-containing protein [Paracoccidioides lutzii Pb01]|uniref:DUF647 domain-containing protein n=1 Tax=Paracoccidioides lutzii (strain ATCC MYA-826 / Pb01) TaxID=502779 RepID=C1HAJ3_PARBA|nr:DUF647 domain-containing protein [Paracoccidioides lutzii Pb01]EEH37366.2 DUF647 domain-containing protein [Paracoccidioides lutzii Pb01]